MIEITKIVTFIESQCFTVHEAFVLPRIRFSLQNEYGWNDTSVQRKCSASNCCPRLWRSPARVGTWCFIKVHIDGAHHCPNIERVTSSRKVESSLPKTKGTANLVSTGTCLAREKHEQQDSPQSLYHLLEDGLVADG